MCRPRRTGGEAGSEAPGRHPAPPAPPGLGGGRGGRSPAQRGRRQAARTGLSSHIPAQLPLLAGEECRVRWGAEQETPGFTERKEQRRDRLAGGTVVPAATSWPEREEAEDPRKPLQRGPGGAGPPPLRPATLPGAVGGTWPLAAASSPTREGRTRLWLRFLLLRLWALSRPRAKACRGPGVAAAGAEQPARAKEPGVFLALQQHSGAGHSGAPLAGVSVWSLPTPRRPRLRAGAHADR